MAERVVGKYGPPLTPEQLIAATGQIDIVLQDAHTVKMPDPTERPRDLEGALVGFMKCVGELSGSRIEEVALESYRNAFLIAAGAMKPVITTPSRQVINLGLEAGLGGEQ